mgnify:CR=1 FL=1
MRLIVYSILNALSDHCGANESYEMLRELKEYIKEDPNKVIDEIEQAIETYSYENNLCQQCGNELEAKIYKERREYMGFDTYEDIIELYCPICGWEE